MSTATVTTTKLRSEGFACPSCVAKIENSLSKLPGVEKVDVKFASGRVEVSHDPSQTSAQALARAVTDLGYPTKVSAF